MKPGDTISVLVCVHSTSYQNDHLLVRAIRSLHRQTFTDFELVVVLDECWGNTKRRVDLSGYHPKFNYKILERPKKQGLAAAKNFGLEHCTGDWIAYLDADDQYVDCKLEVQRNFMLQRPEVDFCSTNAWDFENERMRPNCFSVDDYRDHHEIIQRLPHENIMCHGSMMIRADALKQLGGYKTSPDVLGWEDWELWQRAARQGYIFAKVPERLYIYSLGTSVAR
ncbi:MAG: glycosyltransferase [Candidatus Omnitrophica bacterium]|nr:glycosyltransferase [Candidatus Omnitrophota bacterium]